MNNKRKILVLVLSFSMIFMILALFLPFSKADSTSAYLIHEQELTPVESEWLHYGRDATVDWQEYYDGSNVNFSVAGATGTLSRFGIFTLTHDYYTDRLNDTEILTNFSQEEEKFLVLDSTSAGVTSRNNIGIASSGEFTFIATQAMMTFIILDTYSPSGTNVNWGLRANDTDVIWLQMIPNFHGGLGIMQGEIRYWTGAAWNLLFYMNFSRYTNGSTGYYYSNAIYYLDYSIDGQVALLYGNMTSPNEVDWAYGTMLTPFATTGDDYMTEAYYFFQHTSMDDQPLYVKCIDSTQLQEDFDGWAMLDYTWKTISARSVNEIFTFNIPPATKYQLDRQITNITISSDMSYGDARNLVVDITGNTEETMNITNLDSTYQQITSDIYYQNITFITVNTRYRTLNLIPFNNTIRLNITFTYNPYEPGFPEILIGSVIPAVILLVAPSAIAYTRFKKTGFLMVFFAMTVILMVVGYLPVMIGILIMGVLIMIFLKFMRNSEEP